MADDDQRGRGVAQDRDPHLRQGARVAAGEVRGGEDRYSGQAQGQPHHPACAQPLRVAEEAGEDDSDDGYARYQQPRC
nr:hypothetical protein [Streptomyces bluensis]